MPAVGFEWLYEVSSFGRVKSLNYRRTGQEWLLAQSLNWSGYKHVTCFKGRHRTIRVHVLVGKAFLLNPQNKKTINHINGIKTDNRVENLEWATHKENTQHAWKTWLCKVGENNYILKYNPNKWKFWKNHNRSISVLQLSLNWDLIKVWGSMKMAGENLWIGNSEISKCCQWKRCKTAWWFKWMYENKNHLDGKGNTISPC
mgnify:FL=1